MNKILLLAAIIGAACAVPTVKISSGLSSTLENEESANIMVTFVGGNTKVVNAIESQSFESRGEKLNALGNSLKVNRDASQENVQNFLNERKVAFKSFWISNEISIRGAKKDIIQALATFPEVESIDQEQIVTMKKPSKQLKKRSDQVKPKKFDEDLQWNIEMIQVKEAWNITNGRGVIVVNIDNGIRMTHECLKDNYRDDGYGWFDTYEQTPEPQGDSRGTHSVGIIVGSKGVGVSPGSRWAACRACTPAGFQCYRADLVACGEWVLCPTRADGSGEDCSKAAHISSNSWAGPEGGEAGDKSWFEPITEAWIAGGILPVFPSGDDGKRSSCGTVSGPGQFKRVITVGATDDEDEIARFSGVGPTTDGRMKPDLSAPGEDVLSAWHTGDADYEFIDESLDDSSTASASSHIAGVAALALSVNPNLNFEQMRQILVDGVDRDMTSSRKECGGRRDDVFPNNHFGSGRTNALKVVQAAQALLKKSQN